MFGDIFSLSMCVYLREKEITSYKNKIKQQNGKILVDTIMSFFRKNPLLPGFPFFSSNYVRVIYCLLRESNCLLPIFLIRRIEDGKTTTSLNDDAICMVHLPLSTHTLIKYSYIEL